MYMLQISLQLVAIDKIVAASSPGEHLLPNRGKIKDPNREKHHPEPICFESKSKMLSGGCRIEHLIGQDFPVQFFVNNESSRPLKIARK